MSLLQYMVRLLSLPFVADLLGATAIHPDDPVSAEIFGALWTAVQVGSKRGYDLLAAASALMGTYFGSLEASSKWLQERGLDAVSAETCLRQLFAGLAHAGQSRVDLEFTSLVGEFSTKGGLNEQVLRDFDREGGMWALRIALDAVEARIASQKQ